MNEQFTITYVRVGKRKRIKLRVGKNKTVRWRVVALCAKYFVISKQNDFEANERLAAIYFSERSEDIRCIISHCTNAETNFIKRTQWYKIKTIYFSKQNRQDISAWHFAQT